MYIIENNIKFLLYGVQLRVLERVWMLASAVGVEIFKECEFWEYEWGGGEGGKCSSFLIQISIMLDHVG